MSTRTRSHVMIGAKFTFDEYAKRRAVIGEDTMDKYLDADPGDLTIIADGMESEYAICGIMLAVTDKSGHFKDMIVIKDWESEKIDDLHTEITKVFPNIDFDVRVHVFTHYS